MKKLLVYFYPSINFFSSNNVGNSTLCCIFAAKFMTMIIVEPHKSHIPPTTATIGMFDGVHRGHLSLLQQVRDIASSRGMPGSVVTFTTHPRKVLQPDFALSLLNSFDERMLHLEQSGIDYAITLDFTPNVAQLTARQFITLLHNTYNIQVLCIGYDHRFGHNRSEGWEEYCQYGKELGMEIIQAQVFDTNGCVVSSSAIRRALMAGNIQHANHMLGYHYNITGKVIGGQQLGRKIGFPTANIELIDNHKLIPAKGAYAVIATLPNGTQYGGMMNVGERPTVQGDHTLSIEVHLFDYNDNLYGQQLNIQFIDYMREEKHFDSLETLQRTLHHDADTARNILQGKY